MFMWDTQNYTAGFGTFFFYMLVPRLQVGLTTPCPGLDGALSSKMLCHVLQRRGQSLDLLQRQQLPAPRGVVHPVDRVFLSEWIPYSTKVAQNLGHVGNKVGKL